jgi:hypothetical protein
MNRLKNILLNEEAKRGYPAVNKQEFELTVPVITGPVDYSPDKPGQAC